MKPIEIPPGRTELVYQAIVSNPTIALPVKQLRSRCARIEVFGPQSKTPVNARCYKAPFRQPANLALVSKYQLFHLTA